MLYARMVIIL